MKRQREIILLLASMFLVTVAWISFNLYHNAITSTISAPLSADVVSISPDFNTKIIELLKSRQYVEPRYSFTQQPAKSTVSGAIIPIAPIESGLTSPSATPTPNSLDLIGIQSKLPPASQAVTLTPIATITGSP